MKRLATLVLAVTLLLGLFGVYVTQIDGHVARYMTGMSAFEMQACNSEMCGESVAVCTNHCVSAFVASTSSPLVLVSSVVVFIIVGVWLARFVPSSVGIPVALAQSPPQWQRLRSTIKRE